MRPSSAHKHITACVTGMLLAMEPYADAKIIRSSSAKAEFKREHPCPANGARHGPCGGYVIDHIVPLCAGGPDKPTNMQWQTVPEGKAKDRLERQQCR